VAPLAKKLIADKIVNAAKQAIRAGDNIFGVTVVNVVSLYLYGRDDLLKIVGKSALSALNIAKEERDVRGQHTRAGKDEGDAVDEALDRAAERATIADEERLAGIISFAHSLRAVGRDDLMEKFFDVGESLSCSAVGTKSRKDISIVENTGDAPPSEDETSPALGHPVEKKLEELAEFVRREGLPDLEGVLRSLRAMFAYGHPAAFRTTYVSILGILMAVEQASKRGERYRHDQTVDTVHNELTAAANALALAGHTYAASILHSMMSIHVTGGNELMLQLAEIANSLSTKELGNKPRKVIMVFDNDIEESLSHDPDDAPPDAA
jgi:hypothetical protein